MDLGSKYLEQCRILETAPNANVRAALDGRFPGSVSRLDFSGNHLDSVGMQAVFETIRDCPSLEYVSFENTYVKSLKPEDSRHCTETMETLVNAVRTLPSLTSINLANNNALGFSAAKLLLQLVKNNKHIVELDLDGTSIASATKGIIDGYLTDNTTQGANWASGSPRSVKATPRHVTEEYTRTTYTSSIQTSVKSRPPPQEEPSSGEQPMDVTRLSHANQTGLGSTTLGPTARKPAASAMQCEQLKSQALDHEDRLHRLLSELPRKADVKKTELNDKLQQGAKFLHDYFEVQQSINQSDFTVANLAADLHLGNTKEKVDQLLKTYAPPPSADPDETMNGIIQSVLDRPKAKHMERKEIEQTVAVAPVELVDMVKKLHHIYVTDPVTVESVLHGVAQTDELERRLIGKIDDAERARAQAYDDDNMHKAESYHDESIKLQAQLLKLILDRLANLAQPGDEIQLVATVEECYQRCLELIAQGRQKTQQNVDGLHTDLRAIDVAKEEKAKDFTSLCDDFERMEKRSAQEVHANGQKQHKVWLEIVALYSQLKTLGDQRNALVEKYVADRDLFERQKGDYEQWVDVTTRHQAGMEDALKELHSYLNLLDNSEVFVKDVTKVIRDRIDNVKREVDKVLLDERQKYLKVFRRFYLTIGELVATKERRIEEIEKMMDQNSFQINFVKESLDPNAAMYKAHNMELEKIKENITVKVEWLKDLADQSAIDFEPTEEALRAAGFDFVHPTIELQERIVEKRQNAAQIRNQFEENRREKMSRENDDIQRQANVTKQAKMTGISQLITPLSPRTQRKGDAR